MIVARVKKTPPRSRVNAVAKDLRTPKYRKRIVESKKVYNRKRVTKNIS